MDSTKKPTSEQRVTVEAGEAVIDLRDDRSSPMYDYRGLRRTASLVDDNPFVDPPDGYAAGLDENALAALHDAVGTGHVVMVSGTHGSGRDRMFDEFYCSCHRPGGEHIVTNPVPRSFADVGGSEAREVVGALKAAALSMLSHIRDPSKAVREAQEQVQRLFVGTRTETARNAADELVELLGDLASTTGNHVVLTLKDAEALGRRQVELLGEVLAHLEEMSSPVRVLISGLPSAAESLRGVLPAEVDVVEITLGSQIPLDDRTGAAEYVVALTEASRIPFTRAAAVRLIRDADGMKALINGIGEAAWNHAEAHGEPKVTPEIVTIAGATVIADLTAKYQDALSAYKQGDPSARYVRALHDLTLETGELMHDNDAVLARAGMTRNDGAAVKREALRADGYTMRSTDGRVGLADPQLGQLIERLIPGATKDLA